MSTFIMLVYGTVYSFPSSDRPRGIGVHLHKGFEKEISVYKVKVSALR